MREQCPADDDGGEHAQHYARWQGSLRSPAPRSPPSVSANQYKIPDVMSVETLLSRIADHARLNPMLIEENRGRPARISSFILSNIKMFASTAMPMERIAAATPERVNVTGKHLEYRNEHEGVDQKRGPRDHTRHPVVEDHEHEHESQAYHSRSDALLQRVRSENRVDVPLLNERDGNRQASRLQQERNLANSLDREIRP